MSAPRLPRRFKSMEALEAFAERLGGEPWHLVIEHAAGCDPKACTCEPTFVIDEGYSPRVSTARRRWP